MLRHRTIADHYDDDDDDTRAGSDALGAARRPATTNVERDALGVPQQSSSNSGAPGQFDGDDDDDDDVDDNTDVVHFDAAAAAAAVSRSRHPPAPTPSKASLLALIMSVRGSKNTMAFRIAPADDKHGYKSRSCHALSYLSTARRHRSLVTVLPPLIVTVTFKF